MAKDDIKKAKAENAERIANIAYSGGGHIGQDDLETAFENGAEWRINSVWHNDTEKPQPGKLLVVKTIYGEYDLCYYGAYALWNTVMTWAYMKDLIPTED